MHINEFLMYATGFQVKWLDGKMKKWRVNFGLQQLRMYSYQVHMTRYKSRCLILEDGDMPL